MLPGNYIALIPAYKPGALLPELTQKLHSLGFCVLVVDDGSGSEYRDIFSACGPYATVLRHEKNAGKGCALKTGFSHILTHHDQESVIVTVDADGQHRVEDALALCRIAAQDPSVLVLGSRKLEENVPARSQFGNTVTRLVFRLSTGVAVHDTQTGLRAFGIGLVPRLLQVPGERYEYEMNVLLQFAREKIPIVEQQIQTIYLDNNAQSHFHAVKDSIRIYKEILKFSASSFVGFLVDYGVYSLLVLLTKDLRLSNIVARVVSGSVNFTLNRKYVFQSRENIFLAAGKYIALAALILLGNTLVLEFLVNTCSIYQLLAKILTEITFFTGSWLLQRLVVFQKRTRGEDK